MQFVQINLSKKKCCFKLIVIRWKLVLKGTDLETRIKISHFSFDGEHQFISFVIVGRV